MQQEMGDVTSISASQTSLPLIQQYRVEICAQTTEVVLFTDSLSVLQSLASGNQEDYTLRNLIQSLNSLTSRTTVVPGYLHIPAYMETKWPISWRKREARSSSQTLNLITKMPKRSSETRGQPGQHRTGGYNPQQDTLRLLSRHEQTMIFRLRTCHCRLRSHMKNDWH